MNRSIIMMREEVELRLGKLVLYRVLLMMLLLVLVPIGNGEKGRCFEGERMALLELKSSFLSIGVDYDNRLSTWVTNDTSCCEWELVTCNRTTGHVTELLLHNIFSLAEDDGEPHRDLNLSLFLPFKDLRSLNLSNNLFSGWIQDQGFEKLSSLRNLKILDLGVNRFDYKTIFQDLGALTSLGTLSLASNNWQGEYFRVHELSNLKNLESLDLSGNNLFDTATKQDCESLSTLKKLETLSLEGNLFNKTIILCLSALPSLKNLYLRSNNLGVRGGSNPLQEISVLDKLETLDLKENPLNGSLTKKDCQRLSTLRSLRHLDLSIEYFDKDILRCLGDISSLKYLNLELAETVDSLSNQETTNGSNLEVLILRGNFLNGTLPIEGKQFSSLKLKH